MSDITVFVGASDRFKGREYLVRDCEDGSVIVFAVIHRRPVNSRGFYQRDTVYRTIKVGTTNWRDAVKEASYRKALAATKNGAAA
jgi:hypothetical protein